MASNILKDSPPVFTGSPVWPWLVILLICFSGPALAIQDCLLDGKPVNPANGYTTQGKSGIIQCKDRDTGHLVSERELRQGRFVGLHRVYRDGKLLRESTTNEQGNSQGQLREYTPDGQVILEANYNNGRSAGLTRLNYPNGKLMRLVFYSPETYQELASAELTPTGKLRALRCAPKSVLSPWVDDQKLCGLSGSSPVVTELFNDRGTLTTRLHHRTGELLASELLYENGQIRESERWNPDSKTRELQKYNTRGDRVYEGRWINAGGNPADKKSRIVERKYSDQGKLIQEQTWENGLAIQEARFYLNGQPKNLVEYHRDETGRSQIKETRFHDNGQRSFLGQYIEQNHYTRIPMGVHQQFDAQGKQVSETSHDEQGRTIREREWNAQGKLVRDEAVFADGSRKAFEK